MLAKTHHVAHGTTSSLNALVTGQSQPRVGFNTTTRGHRDSIYIMNVEGRYPRQLARPTAERPGAEN